jgi:hypothetical protein
MWAVQTEAWPPGVLANFLMAAAQRKHGFHLPLGSPMMHRHLVYGPNIPATFQDFGRVINHQGEYPHSSYPQIGGCLVIPQADVVLRPYS